MLMKIFSAAGQAPPLDRSRALVCVAVNQLATPGLGTIMAGRRVGYPQLAVMVAGFGLFVAANLWNFYRLFHAAFDPNAELGDPLAARFSWWRNLGLGLCLAAWLWALWSSLFILRDAQKLPPLIQRVPPLIREHDDHVPPLQPK